MVPVCLKDKYSQGFQGYPSLRPGGTIFTDIPRNIPGDIPPLARSLVTKITIKGLLYRNA